MKLTHANPKEWKEPEKFIPERFDNSDPMSLTPEGKKRNMSSFVPFFGGKRICLGKTFAEKFGIIIAAVIAYSIDFEYVDKINYEKRPIIGFHIEDPLI